MIKLKLINTDIFVFDLNDWVVLRKTHRIMGHLIGTSTNLVPSLPLKLLPEEAWLLIEKDFARLFENNVQFEEFDKDKRIEEEAFLEAQRKEYREVRKAQLTVLIDEIVQKRRQRGDKRSKDEIFEEELDKSSIVSKDNMLWPIFLNDSNENLIPLQLEAIKNLTTPLRTAVFKDLWEKGYYLTGGEKFGGDFLVYLGDPVVFHAIFIVKCLEWKRTFSPTELIAFGRLGVSVKKRAVLASVKNDRVNYTTINWMDA